MAEEKKSKTNPLGWARMPDAKRHNLLEQISNEMRGCHTSRSFEIAGHEYTVRTLSPLEESWADGHVDGQNFYQAGRNRRAPYVAAALVAIDGVSVEELFAVPDDLDATFELIKSNDEAVREWRVGQVLQFLVTSVQPAVITELWTCYQVLETERNEALDKIGPLSTRTSTGESSPTSLPGKAS